MQGYVVTDDLSHNKESKTQVNVKQGQLYISTHTHSICNSKIIFQICKLPYSACLIGLDYNLRRITSSILIKCLNKTYNVHHCKTISIDQLYFQVCSFFYLKMISFSFMYFIVKCLQDIMSPEERPRSLLHFEKTLYCRLNYNQKQLYQNLFL